MARDLPLKGWLHIYIDGYKMKRRHMAHLIPQAPGEPWLHVPDALMPPAKHEVAEGEWWHEGWAVGENSRDRLCMRFGPSKLRRWTNYDEAVAYIYARARRFKTQQHYLVYVRVDAQGVQSGAVVRGLDDVAAHDAKIDAEIAEFEALKEARRRELEERYPQREQLRQHFGPQRSLRLSDFLFELRTEGAASVQATMPKSTYLRTLRDLRAVGIEPEFKK
ncbi:MAG: hypothetical protein FIB06_09455 [Betaproteobacteria bacterium]|nr:hypothetical protein [Betaproteobacteria bacterium]